MIFKELVLGHSGPLVLNLIQDLTGIFPCIPLPPTTPPSSPTRLCAFVAFLFTKDFGIFYAIFDDINSDIMTQIVIDKKKYVLLPEKEYTALQKRASLKTPPAKKLSLAAGRKQALKLIDKWAKEK